MELNDAREKQQQINKGKALTSFEDQRRARLQWRLYLDSSNSIIDTFDQNKSLFEPSRLFISKPPSPPPPSHTNQGRPRVPAVQRRRPKRQAGPTAGKRKEESGERICLGRLALAVRGYLEEARTAATYDNIYRVVGVTQFGQRWQEEALLTPLRRRVCEVLRVMQGVGVVHGQLNAVLLTEGQQTARSREKREQLARQSKECSRLAQANRELQLRKQHLLRAVRAIGCLESRRGQLTCSRGEEWRVRLPCEGLAVDPVYGRRVLEVEMRRGVVVTRGEMVKAMDWVDMAAALGDASEGTGDE